MRSLALTAALLLTACGVQPIVQEPTGQVVAVTPQEKPLRWDDFTCGRCGLPGVERPDRELAEDLHELRCGCDA